MFSKLRFKLIEAGNDFKCPLTLEEIKEPVILKGDGRTYERQAIEQYLKDNDVSPVTLEKLSSKELAPDKKMADKRKAVATEVLKL